MLCQVRTDRVRMDTAGVFSGRILLVIWCWVICVGVVSSGLSCRDLDNPAMNSVLDLGPEPGTAPGRCSGDVFRCSDSRQLCLRSEQRCEDRLPFSRVCDSVDDCARFGASGASADEELCIDILSSYSKTPRASIDIGRFATYRVSLKTCAAYCFFHDWCSMFSYSLTGDRQCKIGCDNCGWTTLAHDQSNADLYNATEATTRLFSSLSSQGDSTRPSPSTSTLLPQPPSCGLRNVAGPSTVHFETDVLFTGTGTVSQPRLAPATDLRVVGVQNSTTTYGEYPWMAQIELLGRNRRAFHHHCGATIVAHQYVITAAHCMERGGALADFQVKVGQFDRTTVESEEQTFAIQEVILHPQYGRMRNEDTAYANDIAVIKLRVHTGNGIVYGDKVQPICLHPQEVDQSHLPATCLISGWGVTTSGATSPADLLVGGEVPLVTGDFCASPEVYGDQFDPRLQVCAGTLAGGIDTCQGDSGGPLACYLADTGSWFLTGIVSSGDRCGRPLKPGIYTRASHFTNWILATIRYLETAG